MYVNAHFASIAPNLANSLVEPSIRFENIIKPSNASLSSFALISRSKVSRLLGCLSNSKATGVGKISEKCFESCSPRHFPPHHSPVL